MEEIQVGEYVRTKKGFIAKVSEVDSGYVFSDDTIDIAYEECRGYVDEKEILKHSFNIIDLIEVGDYVNGYRVVEIMENMQTGTIHLEMTSDYTNPELGDCTIYNKDIESIVTKKMYESIKYEV